MQNVNNLSSASFSKFLVFLSLAFTCMSACQKREGIPKAEEIERQVKTIGKGFTPITYFTKNTMFGAVFYRDRELLVFFKEIHPPQGSGGSATQYTVRDSKDDELAFSRGSTPFTILGDYDALDRRFVGGVICTLVGDVTSAYSVRIWKSYGRDQEIGEKIFIK